MATITTKHNFFDTVYLKTDPDQFPRIVTGFDVRPNGLCYILSCGTMNSAHYEQEMSTEKDIVNP